LLQDQSILRVFALKLSHKILESFNPREYKAVDRRKELERKYGYASPEDLEEYTKEKLNSLKRDLQKEEKRPKTSEMSCVINLINSIKLLDRKKQDIS